MKIKILEIKIKYDILTQRKIRGMTLKELSFKTGISAKQIRKIEKGQVYPKIDSLVKIAIALDAKIDDICFYELQ